MSIRADPRKSARMVGPIQDARICADKEDMGKRLRTAVLTIILLGCGGHSSDQAATAFINDTSHSDADLWAIWSLAQQSLAQSIDLNPVQQTASNAPSEILPGDPRALTTLPQQLTVASVPDVSSAALLAATGMSRPTPTGMIACPQPCNVQYTTAYSRYRPNSTRYAASWEWTPSFNTLLEYEFENQILFALGYDMTWR